MIIQAAGDFDRWIQMRGGQLSTEAANRIMNGEDFDEVIELCLGAHPDAAESQIPSEYWLYESDDIGEITQILENFKTESLSCTADEAHVPFRALIVPLGEEAEDAVLEEEYEAFVGIEALSAHIGEPAAKAIAVLHRKALDIQVGLFKRLYDRDKDDGPRYLWAFLDEWKGLMLSAEKPVSDDHIPNITFVFFLMCWALPSGDEVVDKNGDTFQLIAGQLQYALYMPAIVIGDEVPELHIEDDSDTGIQRLVIQYRDNDVPVVVYDSMATDADENEDEDDDE